jgi:hypothetical protein
MAFSMPLLGLSDCGVQTKMSACVELKLLAASSSFEKRMAVLYFYYCVCSHYCVCSRHKTVKHLTFYASVCSKNYAEYLLNAWSNNVLLPSQLKLNSNSFGVP